jgi:microcin C transport system permease protein
MIKYILNRIALMLPTFFAATFIVFVILNLAPGGPFERAVMQLKAGRMMGGGEGGAGGGRSGAGGSETLTAEQLDQLRKQYGLDKPLPIRYLIWLGLYPRSVIEKTLTVNDGFRNNLKYIDVESKIYRLQQWVRLTNEGGKLQVQKSGIGSDFKFAENYDELPDMAQVGQWYPSNDFEVEDLKNGQYMVSQKEFSGILTGDLGISSVYERPVIELITQRLPISSYFGILGFILSYLVCIPLGISKAIRHNTTYDFLTSALVFAGYAIPGFALGSLLLVLFGGGSFWDIFPLGGFHSPSAIWNNLSFFGKVKDQVWHTILPIICYMIGSFATLTILMKNSLMENFNQDYVRTAFAKGLPPNKVIYQHALRNSLIPLVARIGTAIGVVMAGDFFIEKVFNIDGLGMLGYKAIIQADYPIVMGEIAISVLILLVGNLISDLIYVSVDPRISLD